MRMIEAQSSASAHWSAEAYESIFSGDRPRFALVYHESNIVGFIVGNQDGSEWEIENIAVAQQVKRHGIGSALLSAFMELAQQNDAAEVLLEVRASNEPAQRLYAKHGFVEIGRRRGYYDNPSEDAVLYRKAVMGPEEPAGK